MNDDDTKLRPERAVRADPPADDGSLDTAVPVEVAQTRPKSKSEPAKLGSYDFEDLKNKFVEVRASGYRYSGTLVGADERDLYLRGVTRWWVLPLDRVSDVKLLSDAPPEHRRPRRKGPIPGDPDPSMECEPEAHDDAEPAAAIDEGDDEGAPHGGAEPASRDDA